jgi:hypothetical protein
MPKSPKIQIETGRQQVRVAQEAAAETSGKKLIAKVPG